MVNDPSCWSHTFAGEPANAKEVRTWARATLITAYGNKRGDELADLVNLAASELFSNALFHTASGLPGGKVTVSLRLDGSKDIQLEVTDQGTAGLPEGGIDDPTREGGLGLDVLEALAAEHTISGDEHGRTVTARFPTPALEDLELEDDLSL